MRVMTQKTTFVNTAGQKDQVLVAYAAHLVQKVQAGITFPCENHLSKAAIAAFFICRKLVYSCLKKMIIV
jgi:hypothetical protein